jgi:hypothetical protein
MPGNPAATSLTGQMSCKPWANSAAKIRFDLLATTFDGAMFFPEEGGGVRVNWRVSHLS